MSLGDNAMNGTSGLIREPHSLPSPGLLLVSRFGSALDCAPGLGPR